ncbi:IclR family transcriptional regulator, partial [bacterium]
GKILLAFGDEAQTEKYINSAEFEKFTPFTITTPDDLRAELAKIRVQGYALSEQEYHDGIRGIGAPVFNYQDKIVAAVSITGPVYRLTEERINQELLPLAHKAASEMSRRLGWSLMR